jgi:hypothetical protein
MMQMCPVRDRCLEVMRIDAAGSVYRCGFEIAGTVAACPKRRRMGGVVASGAGNAPQRVGVG